MLSCVPNCGLLVWRFCLRVQVFPPLSVLEVTFFLVKGDTSIAAPADGAAFHLYNGEAESLRVQIRNIGTEDIHRATVEIVASDEAKELLCIENQEMTSKFETLCVMEERSFDIVFGTTSRGDGTVALVTSFQIHFCRCTVAVLPSA